MTFDVRTLTGPALESALDGVAALRITVFRDWPYLYDGTLAYEREYLQSYRDNPGALLVAAFHDGQLIGASTSTKMEDHSAEFAAPFAALGIAPTDILYGAESLILPAYRGQGLGHQFILAREAHARKLARKYVAFCSVLRPEDHPAKPEGARTNTAFWLRHGYKPLSGILAEFAWQDVGATEDSVKQLQFWMREV